MNVRTHIHAAFAMTFAAALILTPTVASAGTASCPYSGMWNNNSIAADKASEADAYLGDKDITWDEISYCAIEQSVWTFRADGELFVMCTGSTGCGVRIRTIDNKIQVQRATANGWNHVRYHYGINNSVVAINFEGTAYDDHVVIEVDTCRPTFISTGGGNDVVEGGCGADRVFAGAGDDVVYGADGDDAFDGGDGADILLGEGGDDRMFGRGGSDLMSGGPGDDYVSGHGGQDIVSGGSGDDSVHGGSDDDFVFGGPGTDYLRGNDGDDVLNTGAWGSGDEELYGDGGNDRLTVHQAGSDYTSYLYGGSGDDNCRGGQRHSCTLDASATSDEFADWVRSRMINVSAGELDVDDAADQLWDMAYDF